MADVTGGGIGGKMLGTNTLQSAIDKLSRSIDQMSTTYSQAKPAAQKMGGFAKSVWTGDTTGSGSGGKDDDKDSTGKNGGHGSAAVKAVGVGATFKALANYGNNMLQTQLPMDQYVYQGSLGMPGNLSNNQSALRKQAFGQNNQNLNAMATSPEDAAQMYSQLGQTAGTPLLNQTAGGQTVLQSARTSAVANPYMSGSQTAAVQSNVYSPSTSLSSQRLGFATPRQLGTGQPRSLSSVTSNILQQSYGGRQPTMKELNAGLGEGGKLNLNMQAAGYNQQSIQSMGNVARVQTQVRSHGGNQQQAQSLINQASQGSTQAQSELQSKYGVPRSDAQSLKNLQASKTGRAADTSSSFNKGISDSTDTLQKFSKAFTDFMDKSGLTNALGYGGGVVSQVSNSIGGMGGLFAGAAGVKSGIGAVSKLTGSGGSESGILSKILGGGGGAATGATGVAEGAASGAAFSNLGRFTPYAAKAGTAAVVAGGIYGVGKTVATKQGRKSASKRADTYAQTYGNAQWLKKNKSQDSLLEKWLPNQMAGVNRWQSGATGWTDEALKNMGSFFGMDTDKVPGEYGGTGESNQRSTTGDGQHGGDAGADRALKWAESISKKHLHYVYGGSGGDSWDCSGFMSGIESVIQGKKPGRLWATTAFDINSKKAPAGWKYHQKAAFMVGIMGGSGPDGHTAGTLLGHNVESNSTGGPRVDRNGARGYKNALFHDHWWGYTPSGKSSGGTPNDTQDSNSTPDIPTNNGGGGIGFGDTYGSTEEVSSLQGLLDGAVGSSGDNNLDTPKQGSETSGDPSSPSGGADAKVKGSWGNVVAGVLSELHLPSKAKGPVLNRIQHESSGNPKNINKSDSNWAAGTPSVGLMQVIKPTFESNAGPYKKKGPMAYGVSEDPHANIYAGVNYAHHKYKSGWITKMNAPGGYWTGTNSAQTMQEKSAKDALKKLKEMPKAAQGPHRILDMEALNGKSKTKNIDLNFSDGAIVLNIKNANDPDSIKQAAQDFVKEVQKLNVYQAVMG